MKSKIKLPTHTHLGKYKTNGIMCAGLAVFQDVAQVFLECGGNKKGCHKSISIIPHVPYANEIIDKITDEQAGKIFSENGWLVKGYNNKKYTRCPICKHYLNVKIKTL